ncbi:MAG: hypothetical protein VX223_10400 [Myxococcota bacterium]|nr:hypothetical protein [Myxococcota bacterium]
MIFAVVLGLSQSGPTVENSPSRTSAASEAVEVSATPASLTERIVKKAVAPDAYLMQLEPLRTVNSRDLEEFRRWFYAQIPQLPDQKTAKRFLEKFPTSESFSASGFKKLLRLTSNPRRRIWSIDKPDNASTLSASKQLIRSASAPDRDGRYQDRLLFDPASGKAVRDTYNRLVMLDPSILSVGRPYGRSSQTSASLVRAMPAEEITSNVERLNEAPSAVQYAYDGPIDHVPMEGASRAQAFTDLAQIAASWDHPAAPCLAISFAGYALWHIVRAANPMSTAQILDSEVLQRTQFLYAWRAFLTSGGYLAPLESKRSTASRISENMRLFVERRLLVLYGRTPTELGSDEARTLNNVHTAFSKVPESGTFTSALASEVARQAAADLPELTTTVRKLACGRLFSDGFRVKHPSKIRMADYDALVCKESTQAQTALDALLHRMVDRAIAAIQRYDQVIGPQLQNGIQSRPELITRLLRHQLQSLQRDASHRDTWEDTIPTSSGTADTVRSVAWPITQGSVLSILTLWFWWVIRRPFPPMERVVTTEDATATPKNESGTSA